MSIILKYMYLWSYDIAQHETSGLPYHILYTVSAKDIHIFAYDI